MLQVKENIAKINAAVKVESERLRKSSGSLWAKDKAYEIRCALNRVNSIIPEIEKSTRETDKKTTSELFFVPLLA